MNRLPFLEPLRREPLGSTHYPTLSADPWIAPGFDFRSLASEPSLKKFHKYYEDRTRGTAIITTPDNMERALAGETGTRITPG